MENVVKTNKFIHNPDRTRQKSAKLFKYLLKCAFLGIAFFPYGKFLSTFAALFRNQSVGRYPVNRMSCQYRKTFNPEIKISYP
jgi:hypothetical protein